MKKFRVWDKEEKRWVEDVVLNPSGTLSRIYETTEELLNPDRYVIQFSTGLTYEDGTEKFEGDVVEVKAWAGADHNRKKETTVRAVIEFRERNSVNHGFGLHILPNGWPPKGLTTTNTIYRCRRVGTIFDNPEILTEAA